MKNKTRKTTTRNNQCKSEILRQSPLTERITSTPTFKEWKNQRQPRIDDSDEIVSPQRRSLVKRKKENSVKPSLASNDLQHETERVRKRERLREKTKRKYISQRRSNFIESVLRGKRYSSHGNNTSRKIRSDDSPPRQPTKFKKKKVSDSIHLDKETVAYGSGLDGNDSARKSKKKKFKSSNAMSFSRPTRMRMRTQTKVVKSEPAISGAEKVFKDEVKRVYEQRLIKIYERKNVRKLKHIKSFMEKNKDDLHGLYIRVCGKYRITPEPRFDSIMDDSGEGVTTSRTDGGPSHSSNDVPDAGGGDLEDEVVWDKHLQETGIAKNSHNFDTRKSPVRKIREVERVDILPRLEESIRTEFVKKASSYVVESPMRATRQSNLAPNELPPPKSAKSRSPMEVFNRKQELLVRAVKMSRSRTPMTKSRSPNVSRGTSELSPFAPSKANTPSRSNSPEFSFVIPPDVRRGYAHLSKRRGSRELAPRRKSSTSIHEQMRIMERKRSSFTDDMNDTGVISSFQEDSDRIISEKQFLRRSRGQMQWSASKKRPDPANDVGTMYFPTNVGGAIMPVSASVRSLPGSNPDSPMNKDQVRVRSQPPTIRKNGESFLESVEVINRLDPNGILPSRNTVTPLTQQRFSPVKNKIAQNRASARLLQACKKNSISHLTSALKHVSNPEASSRTFDKEGLTPLHWAVFYKNATLVKLLVQAQCADTVNTRNNAGQTPLHWVCRNSDHLSLKCLFFVPSIDVNLPDTDGFTPLMWACRSNSPYCVQSLLEREEIDVNFTNVEGHTALHFVCKHNNTRCLVPLIRHPGIDVTAKDSTGCTPMHWACLNDAAETVQILLRSKKCDMNAKNKNNYTPLHYACQSNSVECLRHLLTSPGIDLSVRTDFGNTPCHLLCRDNSVEGFRMLADLGDININAQNKVGLSPLHFICQYNSMDILQALLNRQLLFATADFFLFDENGKTPIDVAERHGHLTLLGFLTE